MRGGTSPSSLDVHDLCRGSLTTHMLQRQHYREHRSAPWRARRADCATMTLGDLATDCQTDACSVIFSSTVQPFEHREDAVGVLLFEADAVVSDRERHMAVCHAAPDLHQR